MNLDSLDYVEFIIALEEEFLLEIPDSAADKFATPKDAALYIHNKLSEPR